MSSIISNYEDDIFISYRQNDNKRDGWVHVQALSLAYARVSAGQPKGRTSARTLC